MPVSSRHAGASALGLLLALVVALPAVAHADLVASSPEDGAVLDTPPSVVTLTFSEGLVVAKSSLRLEGPAGVVADLHDGFRDGDRTMELTDLALGPGAYTIRWVAATDDGHIERGKVTFSVTAATPTALPSPTAGTTPDDGVSPSPTGADSSLAPTVSPTAPSPTAASSPAASLIAEPVPAGSEASGADVILPIALGLILVAGVGLFIARRSRSA